ncbi:hypothetical protein [Agrobacterium rosae]|uniref:hypothetical protein n=1 Tax=Agrobacterium rosae TaxID=1972867 RepID=UPI003BA3AC95
MNAPVDTTNISYVTPISDEVLVNRDGSTALQKTTDLATQLAGAGAIAVMFSAFSLMTGASVVRSTLAKLQAEPVINKAIAVVLSDPDPELRGIYEGVSEQWVRIDDLPADIAVESAQAALEYRNDSREARDAALLAAEDAVAQGFVPIFGSRTSAATFNLSHFDKVTINRWSTFTAIAPTDYEKVSFEPTHEIKFQDAVGNWFVAAEVSIDPLMCGAVADGLHDDIEAIDRLLASPFRSINWGDASRVYRVSRTIVVSQADTKFSGAATLKLDRVGKHIVLLLNVLPSAERFYSDPQMVYDHNAVGIAQPALANQIAFALCCCVLLQAKDFHFSGRLKNSWDSGVGVGQFSWTGNGENVPYSASQVTSQPQGWRVGTVHGENCGTGVHDGSFGESGKKGAVVNVLTGSDGAIEVVTGRDNYNGLIVDFGAGGEASIGETAFTNTKIDTAFPNNGSGIDHFFGASQIVAAALKSDNAGRCGLVISKEAGTINVNARIHASGKEGVRIDGGSVIGNISVTDPSLSVSGGFDAITVNAGQADINLNVNLLVVTSGAPTHRYSYSSSHTGAFRVRGHVGLVSKAALTSHYLRGSIEGLRYVSDSAETFFGTSGLGRTPIGGTTSAVFTLGDVSIDSATGGLLLNLYFDSTTMQWKYLRNGYGTILRLEPSGGLTIYTAPNNINGAGAVAAITAVHTVAANGAIGVNEGSPDYKLDVNGTFGFTPGASVTPVDNGDVVFQLTSNTQFTVKAKGSDGIVRSGNIALA